jgi:hypothetical protein
MHIAKKKTVLGLYLRLLRWLLGFFLLACAVLSHCPVLLQKHRGQIGERGARGKRGARPFPAARAREERPGSYGGGGADGRSPFTATGCPLAADAAASRERRERK